MSTAVPSTSERAPMAFTCDDLGRGAFAAWVTFMVILLAVFMAFGIVAAPTDVSMLLIGLGYVMVVGGVIATIVMLACSPLAWLVGMVLRHVRHLVVHATAFGTLGAGIGVGVVYLWCVLWSGISPADALSSPWAYGVIAATAMSVLTGWAWALRHAMRYYRPLVG